MTTVDHDILIATLDRLKLTERGRDARSKTWEVYDAAIAEGVGDKLTDEAETLARLLSKLRAPTP